MNLAPACAAYSGTAALGAVVHKSSAHCRVRFPFRLRPSPVKKEGTKARQGKRGGEGTAAAKKDDAIFMDQPRHRHEKSLEGERRKREREEAGRRYTEEIAAIIIIKKKETGETTPGSAIRVCIPEPFAANKHNYTNRNHRDEDDDDRSCKNNQKKRRERRAVASNKYIPRCLVRLRPLPRYRGLAALASGSLRLGPGFGCRVDLSLGMGSTFGVSRRKEEKKKKKEKQKRMRKGNLSFEAPSRTAHALVLSV